MDCEMKLKPVYFDKIKAGEKIYEIRLNDEKRQLLKVGDILTFKKEPELKETISAEIIDLIHFKSFSEMLEVLPADKIGFKDYSKLEIENVYHKFYSVEDELRYGVVAIKLKI